MDLARAVAHALSSDPDTRTGCLLLDPDTLQVRGAGANAFPRGVLQTPDRARRPRKYAFVTHAEVAAVCNAARSGARTAGSVAVVTLFPCAACAGALIAAGTSEVWAPRPDASCPTWGEAWADARQMLDEAGVRVRFA